MKYEIAHIFMVVTGVTVRENWSYISNIITEGARSTNSQPNESCAEHQKSEFCLNKDVHKRTIE